MPVAAMEPLSIAWNHRRPPISASIAHKPKAILVYDGDAKLLQLTGTCTARRFSFSHHFLPLFCAFGSGPRVVFLLRASAKASDVITWTRPNLLVFSWP